MDNLRLLPGLALTAALAALAMTLGGVDWFMSHGLSALTVAIVLGILIGNSLYPRLAARSGSGVAFSKQTLLRAGVVLYGLRLTLHDIGHVGVAGVLIDALVILTTFGLAHGTRAHHWTRSHLLDADRRRQRHLWRGGGHGHRAGSPRQTGAGDDGGLDGGGLWHAVDVSVSVALQPEPALVAAAGRRRCLRHLRRLDDPRSRTGRRRGPLGQRGHGRYRGHHQARARHDAGAVSDRALGLAAADDPATHAASPSGGAHKLPIPWFAFGFIAIVLFNSLALLPARVVSVAIQLDTLLLAMAMAALGLCTHVRAVRQAGLKPLLLGSLLFVWLIVGGGSINRLVSGWLG